MAYATYADLVTYMVTVDETQAEAERLLARASELIDELLIGAWYPTSAGLPTEAEHIAAFRDATCAQVAYFMETGDDQGTASRYSSVRIGDVSLTSGSSGKGSSSVASRIAPHVRTIFRNAGLLPATPIVWG